MYIWVSGYTCVLFSFLGKVWTAFADFQRSAIGIAGMSDGDSHQNQKKRGGLKRLAMQLAKVV